MAEELITVASTVLLTVEGFLLSTVPKKRNTLHTRVIRGFRETNNALTENEHLRSFLL